MPGRKRCSLARRALCLLIAALLPGVPVAKAEEEIALTATFDESVMGGRPDLAVSVFGRDVRPLRGAV